MEARNSDSLSQLFSMLDRAKRSVDQRARKSSDGEGSLAPASVADHGDGADASKRGGRKMSLDTTAVEGHLMCSVDPEEQSFAAWEPPLMHHFEMNSGASAARSLQSLRPSGELVDGADNVQTNSNPGGRPTTASLPRRNVPRALPPGATTLVVRNIPARYTKEKLLLEWPPDGSFDLIHIPYNIDEQRSVGYAFINCVSHEAALAFQTRIHGTYLRQGYGKHLDVIAAEVQGLQATLELFGSTRKLQKGLFEELLPALFEGKVQLSSSQVLERLGLKSAKLMSLSSYLETPTYAYAPHRTSGRDWEQGWVHPQANKWQLRTSRAHTTWHASSW